MHLYVLKLNINHKETVKLLLKSFELFSVYSLCMRRNKLYYKLCLVNLKFPFFHLLITYKEMEKNRKLQVKFFKLFLIKENLHIYFSSICTMFSIEIKHKTVFIFL